MPAIHRVARWLGLRGLRGARAYTGIAAAARALPDGALVRFSTGGSCVCDSSDWISRNAYFGLYERPEMAIYRGLLKEGDTAVDVGANVGYWTTHFAHWAGHSGRVIAIEPSPRCLERLEAAVAHVPGRVEIVPAAAGAESGGGVLTGSGDAANSGLGRVEPEGSTHDGIPVRVRPLSDILATHHVDRCSLVKVDTEGGDAEVLEGLRDRLMADAVDAIVLEVGGGLGESERIAALFADLSRTHSSFRITEAGRLRRRPQLVPLTASAVTHQARQTNVLLLRTTLVPRLARFVVQTRGGVEDA